MILFTYAATDLTRRFIMEVILLLQWIMCAMYLLHIIDLGPIIANQKPWSQMTKLSPKKIRYLIF